MGKVTWCSMQRFVDMSRTSVTLTKNNICYCCLQHARTIITLCSPVKQHLVIIIAVSWVVIVFSISSEEKYNNNIYRRSKEGG